jgi:hypothetical protein
MSSVRRLEASTQLCAKLFECVDEIKLNHLKTHSLDEPCGDEVSDDQLYDMMKREVDVAIAPNKKLFHFSHDYNLKLIRFLMDSYPKASIIPSGNFIYPAGGFMGWHTNSDFPCKRVYVTVVDEVNKSGFKYYENGVIYDDADDEKVIIREFGVGSKKLFWHSVYSKTNRYSFGFRVESF